MWNLKQKLSVAYDVYVDRWLGAQTGQHRSDAIALSHEDGRRGFSTTCARCADEETAASFLGPLAVTKA